VSNSKSIHDPADTSPRWSSISIESLATPISAIAFWLAIAIPALYVPLIATGVDGPGELGLFFGVFGFHLLSLFLGRSYRQ